ncbi:uncharacterized protein LOC121737060 [Aricia agestis]|uniref:uncharacterized protein LOC121737060 n=1 Tax=Aricia agestis TaxID=91739 RepID=UPI001C209D83|nr:uncharacterized protein LOC121737060 [Aricia agestis]
MSGEKVLRDLIDVIAKERGYVDYQVTIKPISSGGANYSTNLFLATLSTQGKELHLFAKVAALGEKLRETITGDFYVNEQYFYTNILKRYKEIEEKYGVKAEDRFITAEFYAGNTEYLHETLVLEDLSARGFSSFNRFESIDWPYASFAIKQLAIFHALSIAYSREYPSEYEHTVKNKLSEFPMDVLSSSMDKAFDKAVDAVKEENKERLIQWLKNPKIRRSIHKLYKSTGIPPIRHADFRPDNMMHKKLDDGTVQVITLDYQTMMEGSPVADLVYFILLGSDKKFRDEHLQDCFDLYYSEFEAALRRFNIDSDEVYSQQTYQKEIKEFLPYMLSLSMFFLLMVTVDKNDAPKVDDGFEIDDMNVPPSKLYVERINDLVEDFIDLEVL